MQHTAVGDYRVPILSRKFLVGFPKISLAGLRVAWLRPGSLDRPPRADYAPEFPSSRACSCSFAVTAETGRKLSLGRQYRIHGSSDAPLHAVQEHGLELGWSGGALRGRT